MATSLAIQSSIPYKVRGFIVDKSSGRPLGGVVVEAIAQPIKDSDYAISLGLLVSDHAGYVSFDLGSLCNVQRLEHLWIWPIGDDSAKIDLVTQFSATSTNQTTADQPTFYRAQFAVKTDGNVACNCNGSIYLPSIQNPDIEDWEISPYSFSTKSDQLLGEDGCEVPVPSTETEREFRFAQVIRKTKGVDQDAEESSLGFSARAAYTASTSLKSKFAESLVTTPLNPNRDFKNVLSSMEIVYGEVLEFRQQWKPKGHALGKILYSTALAPCESIDIAVIDWSRKDEATRADSIVSKESLYHSQRRDRTIEESINAALDEEQGGFSLMGGNAGAASATIPIETVNLNVGAVHSFGGAYAKSWGSRDLTGKSVQDLHDSVIQSTNLVRSLNSTVVVQATQEEQNYLQTRTITNHNHCHALTIQYYEVLRHFKVSTQYIGSREVVLLPFQIITFNAALALRFRLILESVLLDRGLTSCWDAMVRLNVSPDIYKIEKYQKPASNSSNNENPAATKPKIDRFEITLESNPKWNWGTTYGPITIDLRLKNGTFENIWSKGSVSEGAQELNKLNFPVDKTNNRGIDPIDIDMVRVSWKEDNGNDSWGFAGIRIRFAVAGRSGLAGTIIDEHGEPELKRFDNSVDFVSWTKDVSIEAPPSTTDLPPSDNKSEDQPPSPIYSQQEDACCESQIIAHLNDNSAYYSRAIWVLQDPTERVMMVSAALANFPSILDQIDFTPIAVSGNYVAFPLNEVDDEQKEEVRRKIPPRESIISIPTRGMFAETHLSHCNACEKRDVTRFWKWEESPCEKPPTIEGITPGPRGQAPEIQPTALPAPVVQIMQPPAAPDPVGLAAAFKLLGQPDIFRDMSGLKELEDLLEGLASGAVDLVEGQQKLEALKLKQQATSGSGGRSLPSESDAGNQIDKLDAIKYAQDNGLIDETQGQNAAEGVLGGGRPLLASADAGFIPDAGSGAQFPWAQETKWSDKAPGTSGTYIDAYHAWVKAHYIDYNKDPCLCNWFPLRLLIEYAAEHHLRLRLRYWPGTASTTGGSRSWDFSKIYVHDSHSGRFSSKEDYYNRVKSTVTARMIGELNTASIARANTKEGDLVVYDLSDAYWHVAVAVSASATELVLQSGSTPTIAPDQHESKSGSGTPSGAFGSSPRRWNFSQFEGP